MSPLPSSHAPERSSGIELIKVGAIFIIVLSHIVQSLSTLTPYLERTDFLMALQFATREPSWLLLSLLRYGGSLGNLIFFLCSAWFLVDSSTVKGNRLLRMALDLWVVSLLTLGIVFVLRRGNIHGSLLLESILPLSTGTNWYVTCYVLLYAAHPLLNRLIRSLDQRQLLRCCAALTVLFVILSFLKATLFFGNYMTIWLALYFDMAYFKRYMKKWWSSPAFALGCFLLGFGGHIALVVLTNVLGLRIGFLQNMMFQWNKSTNPFLILTALGALLLARQWDFRSKIINGLSSLSLLVYILHETPLFREYYRPLILAFIYDRFGYDHILLWVLAAGAGLFLAALAVAAVYTALLERPLDALCRKMAGILAQLWQAMEALLIRFS